MRLDERYVPYLQMAGLYHLVRLNESWLRLDEPLVSPFMEHWRPEMHTFYMPFEECTITLQDVAYQLGLPINGHYETFGELPDGADAPTVRRYAWVYIIKLLGTQLFGDKSGTRIHIRWLAYTRGEVSRTVTAASVMDLLAVSWIQTHWI
ncbi:protein MAIN-LIKE 2-like [Arachis duranensis]|uniref:Protein MAIN-LIKE 2-like n=1 Tax=Arachis duranensis TaxID=130453 RepID=A0A6P4DL34_ARADU|nr:protein MAIN-LIKE 2-like [Arachis duranensis]